VAAAIPSPAVINIFPDQPVQAAPTATPTPKFDFLEYNGFDEEMSPEVHKTKRHKHSHR
jgi:hypothetical protein